MSFNLLVGLVIISISLHNLEESIWFPDWSQSEQLWRFPVDKNEFRFAAVIVTLICAVAGLVAIIQGSGSIGVYLISGIAFAMALNVFVPHIAISLHSHRYMPGTLTAIVLVLPSTLALLVYVLQQAYVELPIFLWVAPALAIALLALLPFLFWLARHTGIK